MSVPQNDGLPDTQRLYAWLARDSEGWEGVVTIPHPEGGMLPLVFGDEQRARKFRDLAWQAALWRKTTAKLVMFTRAEELDEITPM